MQLREGCYGVLEARGEFVHAFIQGDIQQINSGGGQRRISPGKFYTDH